MCVPSDASWSSTSLARGDRTRRGNFHNSRREETPARKWAVSSLRSLGAARLIRVDRHPLLGRLTRVSRGSTVDDEDQRPDPPSRCSRLRREQRFWRLLGAHFARLSQHERFPELLSSRLLDGHPVCHSVLPDQRMEG